MALVPVGMHMALLNLMLLTTKYAFTWCIFAGIQWNPSKTNTIGTKDFVLYNEVSLAQGLVVDHTPPTIVASHDKARLSTMKNYTDKRFIDF